jgi:hypothetical protein
MNIISKWLTALALLVGPVAANATAVTYDFTGNVTGASGIYASAGATVTGTYTIDVGAGNASQSVLPVSFSSVWYSQAYGGTVYGPPTPSSLVFASTLSSGGVTYGNTTPSSAGSDSSVEGNASSGTLPNSYVAEDVEYSNSNDYVESYFRLYGGTGAGAPFDASGLPVFSNATSNSGALTSDNLGLVSQLTYTITSLAPVPLPASAWLLLSGLVGVGVMARKRRDIAA